MFTTPKEALKKLTSIAHSNKDIEMGKCGNYYEFTINGHGRGWIKSGLKKPKELLAWVEGIDVFIPIL